MKEKEAFVDFKEHQLVLYVEKDDGSYGPMQTGSYIAANYIDDFWEKRKHLEEEYLGRVVEGSISPIAYYMAMEDLTPSELAGRVGLSKRRVRKHMDPRGFGKISLDLLYRYADVFNVPATSLLQAPVVRHPGLVLAHEKTKNPYFGILKIMDEKK